MKILIVEDSLFFRQQLKDILYGLGYEQVIEAVDGRDALVKLNRSHFGLVFLDWLMPKVTGLQVLNVIRHNQALMDIPVVMVTSQKGKKHILEAVKAGVSSYVVKPFDSQTIEAKLREIGLKRE